MKSRAPMRACAGRLAPKVPRATWANENLARLRAVSLGETQAKRMVNQSVLHLRAGQRATVPPLQPHRVTAAEGARCRFVIVQGVGTYDYLPEA
jgi:hypothetical protein